jgi:hypothetical protein
MRKEDRQRPKERAQQRLEQELVEVRAAFQEAQTINRWSDGWSEPRQQIPRPGELSSGAYARQLEKAERLRLEKNAD